MLFEHLTIPLSVCSHFVPQTPTNYKEESLGGGPKMLVVGFEVWTQDLIDLMRP